MTIIEHEAQIMLEPNSTEKFSLTVFEHHKKSQLTPPLKTLIEVNHNLSTDQILDFVRQEEDKYKSFNRVANIECAVGVGTVIGGVVVGGASNEGFMAISSIAVGLPLFIRGLHLVGDEVKIAESRLKAIIKEKHDTYFKDIDIKEGFRPRSVEPAS